MHDDLRITDVQLTAVRPADARTGLLGFITCTLNDRVRLDGITLRRTRTGRLALTFPARRDRRGHEHAYVAPLDDAARREIDKGRM